LCDLEETNFSQGPGHVPNRQAPCIPCMSIYMCIIMPINLQNKTGGVEKGKSKKVSCFSFVLALWRQSLASCVLILEGKIRLQATPDVFRERERERESVTGRFSDLPPGGWFHLFLSQCSVSCLLREVLTLAALAAELQKIAGERRRERLILILPPHSDCLMSFTISPSFSFSLSIAPSETPSPS